MYNLTGWWSSHLVIFFKLSQLSWIFRRLHRWIDDTGLSHVVILPPVIMGILGHFGSHLWSHASGFCYFVFMSCQGRNISTSKHVLKWAVGASDEWREVIDAHWPPTLPRFPPPATVCPDSMWALAPYVGPAVAPSGAFRLTTCCQTRLRLCVCLKKKRKKRVQFTLCCSLYVTHPREDFHLLLLLLAKGGNGPRRSRWGGGLGCSIKRPAGLVWLPLSTLPG